MPSHDLRSPKPSSSLVRSSQVYCHFVKKPQDLPASLGLLIFFYEGLHEQQQNKLLASSKNVCLFSGSPACRLRAQGRPAPEPRPAGAGFAPCTLAPVWSGLVRQESRCGSPGPRCFTLHIVRRRFHHEAELSSLGTRHVPIHKALPGSSDSSLVSHSIRTVQVYSQQTVFGD